MPASELSTSYYNFSYKKKKTILFLTYLAFLFLSSLNTIKILKHPGRFEYANLFWPVLFIIYIIIVVDWVFATTTFKIAGKQLTVFNRNIFYKRARIFETDKIEELEVEQVKIKSFSPTRIKITGEHIVTFLYNEQEVSFGTGLKSFDAEQLLAAISSAKS